MASECHIRPLCGFVYGLFLGNKARTHMLSDDICYRECQTSIINLLLLRYFILVPTSSPPNNSCGLEITMSA